MLAGSDRLAQVLAGWAEASGTSTQQGAGRSAGRDEARVLAAGSNDGSSGWRRRRQRLAQRSTAWGAGVDRLAAGTDSLRQPWARAW